MVLLDSTKQSYRVVTNVEVNIEDWTCYVNASNNGTFFHGPHIEGLYRDLPDIKPFSLFVVDEYNAIHAMLLGYIQVVRSGFGSFLTTRAVIPQSPIYSTQAALNTLMGGYKDQIQGKAIYTELRAHVKDETASSVYQSNGFTYEDHLNYIVDCRDPDRTWRSFSDSKKRQIKKAVKNGVSIIENPSLEQVVSFYSILSNLYRNKVKKPLISIEYFRALYDLGMKDGIVKFLLVMKDDRVIGGIVCPVSENMRIHEHYIAALDAEYKDCYPSVMATWAAIDYACKNRISEFDFMGAGNPKEDYGVREFKSKFGGELQNPGRFINVHNSILYRVAKTGFMLFQKLGRAL